VEELNRILWAMVPVTIICGAIALIRMQIIMQQNQKQNKPPNQKSVFPKTERSEEHKKAERVVNIVGAILFVAVVIFLSVSFWMRS